MAGQVFKRTARDEKIWFGVELEDGSIRRFDCRDQIPAGIVLSVSNIVTGTDDKAAQGASAVSTIRRLLRAAIIKPQQKLFWKMVEGEDFDDEPDSDYVGGIIDPPQMMDIATSLAEAYTERPTGGSSAPGSQTTTDGSDSRVGAPQPEPVTYSLSQPFAPSISSSTGVSARP